MSGIYGKDFAAIYNEMWYNFSRSVWPFISDKVRRRVPGARTWLDLCCGTGHLLKILETSGIRATGLDASRHQLAFARQNAPHARLVRGDVRSFDLGGSFDVVTCLFDSLNYLTTRRDVARAFARVRRHLRKGGLFIFDFNTFDGLQNRWRAVSVKRSDRFMAIVETYFDDTSGLGRAIVTGFVKDGRLYRRFQEEHVQRGYRAAEIDSLLDRAGFAFKAYDARTFSGPRARSARLLYVCSR